ncbi:MAG: RHS repeat protein, partial [Candidatus Latescibacterota bacterium]
MSDPDILGKLEQVQLGWRFTNQDNVVEEYDSDGKLVFISQTKGNPLAQTLSYDLNDRLTTVTGAFGRTLTFAYNSSDRIASMTDASGNVYKYTYANDNLVSVLYPDETPSDDSDNPKRIYHYEDVDFPNALTGITDERGIRFSTYAYDVQGRAILSEHAGGANRHVLAFTAAGPTTITDPLGQTREYTNSVIHGSNKNTGISDGPCATCGSQSSTTTYDANGFPASVTDYNGNVTTFVHDSRGLETSRTDAVGTPEERTITTQWHVDFRLPTLITEPGKTTEFAYDPQGRLLTHTESDTLSGKARTVTNTYNAQGLLATRDGPRTDVTDVTTFTYDSQGNLSEVMNAVGHINRVTAYDPNGRPLALEGPNGLITKLSYDSRGRLTSRDVGGQLTRFEYDSTGNITKTTLADGSFLVSEYDDAQRLVAMEDNLGNRTEFALDAAGNRVAETVQDPASTITQTRSHIYNSLNRLTRDVGGAGQTTDFEFDLQGNQTAVIDGNKARTASEYDALNRLAKNIDPNRGETTFGYDTRDNLTSVTDAEGLTTTFTYDGLDNLVAQMSPDTGFTWFTYDDAGNRLNQTDARGVLAQFGYDALNRLVSITYPDSTKDVGFEYDRRPNGIGRLTRMTDASGSTDFAYDIRGNLLSETRTVGGVGYVTAYTYDNADRVLTVTYPSGTMIIYTRDALGRIEAISATSGGPSQVLASNIAYLPFGPIEGFDYGNGIPLA